MHKETQGDKAEKLHCLKRIYLEKAADNAEKAKHSKCRKKDNKSFPSDIIGQRIRHLWTLNGKDIWCKGTVLRESNRDDLASVDAEDEQYIGQVTFYTVRYMWKTQEYAYPLEKEWEDGCVQLIA